MGLDSRLTFFQSISPEMVERIRGKDTRDINLSYLTKEEYENETSGRYENIKKYMTPVEAYITETDWDKIRNECGVPENWFLTRIGPNVIGYTSPDGKRTVEKEINIYSNKYLKTEPETVYFYDSETVYEWRRDERQDKIKVLFDDFYPEEWDKRMGKKIQKYAKFYPLTPLLLERMGEIDLEFKQKYKEGVANVFYSCDY